MIEPEMAAMCRAEFGFSIRLLKRLQGDFERKQRKYNFRFFRCVEFERKQWFGFNIIAFLIVLMVSIKRMAVSAVQGVCRCKFFSA